MFRLVVLSFFYSLLTLSSVSQTERSAISPLNNVDPRFTSNQRPEPRGAPGTQISVARLKVPRNARLLYDKALEAWRKQEPAEAQRKLDEALKLDPAFPDALTLYGGIQAAQQQWDSAEQSLQAAIRSDAGFSPAYIVLAGVYNSRERFDEAEEAAQRARSAGADTWLLQYEIARTLIGKAQFERALTVCEAALRSDHGSLMHLARAHALLGLGKYPEAGAELEVFLHDQPSGDGSQDARDLLKQVETVISR